MHVLIRPLGHVFGTLAPAAAGMLASRLATSPRRGHAADRIPAGAEPVTFRFGLRGLRWGSGGLRVLALHGWQGRAGQFDTLAQALVTRGMQVIAVDAPAHGRSPGNRAHATAFADSLLEIAAELGSLHAVVGHSMGGGAALFALANGLSAERAVIFASPSRFADVLDRLAAELGLPPRASLRFVQWMERLTGVPVRELDMARLARRAPELMLVHDHDDPVIPFADAERIRDASGASLLATRRLGHRDVLREPAVVAQVAQFLAARAAPAPGAPPG